MRQTCPLAILAAMVFCSTALAQTTASCAYTVFQYPGATSTAALGINHYNTVVGTASIGIGPQFGFIRWPNGTFSKVNIPGSASTVLQGRNDNGDMVGFYTAANAMHGFIIKGNTTQMVNFPGQSFTALLSINNYGSTVGFVDTSNAQDGLKRWANGSFVKIQYPKSTATEATGINDSGVIVGVEAADSGPGTMIAFALINGKFQQINDPSASNLSTFVSGISNSQVIVGTGYTNPSLASHGFRIVNGTLQKLPLPSGADKAQANGINRDGVIVGAADFNGTQKAYIAHCQ